MRFYENAWQYSVALPVFRFRQCYSCLSIRVFLTVTVVAAPIGMGLMEYGKFLFAPFGHAMISKSDLNVKQNPVWKAYSTIVMIIYLPLGLILALIAVFQVAAQFVTIINIPVALVIAKSLGTYLNPVNKICVHSAVVEEIEHRKAKAEA